MTPVRIGDAERDATLELLNQHFADGRLTSVEHDERTAAALTATTQRQLDALLADLPDLRDPTTVSPRRRPPLAVKALHAVRLALLAVVALFVAVHVLPVIALVAVFILVTRLLFGWRHPWRRGWRYGAHW